MVYREVTQFKESCRSNWPGIFLNECMWSGSCSRQRVRNQCNDTLDKVYMLNRKGNQQGGNQLVRGFV